MWATIEKSTHTHTQINLHMCDVCRSINVIFCLFLSRHFISIVHDYACYARHIWMSILYMQTRTRTMNIQYRRERESEKWLETKCEQRRIHKINNNKVKKKLCVMILEKNQFYACSFLQAVCNRAHRTHMLTHFNWSVLFLIRRQNLKWI